MCGLRAGEIGRIPSFSEGVFVFKEVFKGDAMWALGRPGVVVRGALIVLGPYALRENLINRVVGEFREGNLHLTKVGVIRLASRILDRRCTRLDSGPFFRQIGSTVVIYPIVMYYFRNISTIRMIEALANPAGKHLTTPNAVHKSCDVDFRRGVIRTSSSPRATRIRLGQFFGPRRVFRCGRTIFNSLCTGSRCWGRGPGGASSFRVYWDDHDNDLHPN